MPEQHRRGRRHRDADERVERHGYRQSESLPPCLRCLRFGVAREIGNVERQRGPVAHHRRQGRKEHGQELAGRMKLAGRREHGSEAARLDPHPDQQQRGHHEHEWRAERLQVANGFDSAPHHHHVQQPEQQKAGPQNPADARQRRPDDNQHRVNRLTADPRLDAEPAAGHDGPQDRRQVRAAHSERRADEDGEGNAVLGARVRIQQHGNQHDQIAEQHRAHRLLPVHPLGDERRSKLIGGDLHRHGEPQRNVVVESPRPLRRRSRREVAVRKTGINNAQMVLSEGSDDRSARRIFADHMSVWTNKLITSTPRPVLRGADNSRAPACR